MAKDKKKASVTPISDPLKEVVKDFKKHMKSKNVSAVKLKDLTYDQVLEKLVDFGQARLEEHSRQQTAIDAGEAGRV